MFYLFYYKKYKLRTFLKKAKMQTKQTLKTFIKANFDKITAANIKDYYFNYIETSEDETASLKDFKEIYALNIVVVIF